jgi:hypothetical protein
MSLIGLKNLCQNGGSCHMQVLQCEFHSTTQKLKYKQRMFYSVFNIKLIMYFLGLYFMILSCDLCDLNFYCCNIPELSSGHLRVLTCLNFNSSSISKCIHFVSACYYVMEKRHP